jgi:argininosuccinate synthase
VYCAEDFEAAKAKALKIGASACYVEDLRREFIEELCFPAVQCNAIYENVYLLGEYLSIHICKPILDRHFGTSSADDSLGRKN